MNVPYPDARVETPGGDPLAIKSNCIDMAVVALESVQTPALRDAPYLGRGVVTPRDNNVTLDLQAADARLVTHENIPANSGVDIPYPEGSIAGPRDGRVCIRHLEAANRRGVTAQGMQAGTVESSQSVAQLGGKQNRPSPQIHLLTQSSNPKREHPGRNRR